MRGAGLFHKRRALLEQLLSSNTAGRSPHTSLGLSLSQPDPPSGTSAANASLRGGATLFVLIDGQEILDSDC